MKRRNFLLALALAATLALAGCAENEPTALEANLSAPTQSETANTPPLNSKPESSDTLLLPDLFRENELVTVQDLSDNLPNGFELSFTNSMSTRFIFKNKTMQVTVDQDLDDFRNDEGTWFHATEIKIENFWYDTGAEEQYLLFSFGGESECTYVSNRETAGFSRELAKFLYEIMAELGDDVASLLGSPEDAALLCEIIGDRRLFSVQVEATSKDFVVDSVSISTRDDGFATGYIGEGFCQISLRPKDQELWSTIVCESADFETIPVNSGVVEQAIVKMTQAVKEKAILPEGNEYAQEPFAYSDAQIGDIIQFGGCDWLVLDVQGTAALILSDALVERRAYNTALADVTWETCDLRTYLNGEFYNSFSTNDKSRIVETNVINSDNPWYGTSGGNDTNDKIFVLSLDEVIQYFGDSGEIQNKSDNGFLFDEYNETRKAYLEVCWLRSPGGLASLATIVDTKGSIGVVGIEVYGPNGGVRPAMWINLN